MSTKVKSILFLVIFCFCMLVFIDCQLEYKEKAEQKNKVEKEIVEKVEKEKTKEKVKEKKEEKKEEEQNETEQLNNSSSKPIIKEENNTNSQPQQPQPQPPTESNEGSNLVSLGTFKLTAYCPCSKCCGKWAGGNTASGTKPTANRTIAVDTSVIPFGTKVVINGITYVAEDTGSGVNGKTIDIYFNDHQTALNFGVQYKEVFLVK